MSTDGQEKVKPVMDECEQKMEKAIFHLKHEFDRIRAGKATPHTLDAVKVDSYGALVPLNQVANIAIPEARLIVITPWDKNQLKAIEKGIINANLGFNPMNDGNVVRVSIAALTEETRLELAKEIKNEGEHSKVTVRNARKDANSELDNLSKNNGVAEDRRDNEKQNVQDLTDKYNKEIEELVIDKEKDILTI
ncbi:MAG: ribosome recycling factor [Candidatus Delongbacteria bacterium]|jgi:ribosome recycling factor|nr:ribosome recycling factor [Candidatus Delongbacteria bacterium]